VSEHAPSLESPHTEAPPQKKSTRLGFAIVAVAVAGVAGVALWGGKAGETAEGRSAAPKPVGVVVAATSPFQPSRTYVGTLEPWLSANVGPQLVSAYVDTVLVRPGVAVKRGEVLATLDCRDANAQNQSVQSSARAIAARQKALASQSSRVDSLLAGKFVAPMDAEKAAAASAAEAAELEGMKAKLSHSTLEVNDCILRAPFDGEVATRVMDPGAFAKPGVTLVSVVDRSTVRFTAEVPEVDFPIVLPGTVVRISVSSTKQELRGVISRRAPAADPSTRTVHIEVDLADPDRAIPVGTTGEARFDVGPPEPATVIPLAAASVRGAKATVFVVEDDVAHARTVAVKGEGGANLFVDPSLAPGAHLVTEGRALLTDGDRVSVNP
jgi:RND family efflux transporter MFP subunit